jgi:Ser/Thr protein kinase RdoA (MazF antagonist)
VLQSSPEKLADMVHELGRWLDRWHEFTVRPARATPGRLTSEILEPARAVADQMSGGAAYLRWLEARCALLEGAYLPFVASHNDLTMSNVLVTDDGTPAVLDWEGAREDGLPLVDLFYSAAAACRAARPRRHVVPALIEAFDDATALGREVAAIAAATAKGLGLSLEMVELLKHTVAVQHAADEQRRGASHSRPFLQLVGWLARSQVPV